MPFIGDNTCVFDFTQKGVGRMKIDSHQHFALATDFRRQTGTHPLSYFLAPVRVYLDEFVKSGEYSSIHLVGLSGGGWTVTVYAALDPRVATAFSVAGDIPSSWRNPLSFSFGDYEQVEIVKFADYHDLYIMALYSDGLFDRHKYNLYNSDDPENFSAKYFKFQNLQNMVRQRISMITKDDKAAGRFTVRAFNNDRHSISDKMAEFIFAEIDQRHQ